MVRQFYSKKTQKQFQKLLSKFKKLPSVTFNDLSDKTSYSEKCAVLKYQNLKRKDI